MLAPDLRGLGDTAKPATGYHKVMVANDIRALVSKLGLGPRVSVIGHDMGGMVTYAYAAQHPEGSEPPCHPRCAAPRHPTLGRHRTHQAHMAFRLL